MVLFKIIYSVLALGLAWGLHLYFKRNLRNKLHGYGLRASQEKLLNRFYALFLFILAIIALIVIWGLNFENVWLFLTSIVGLVAIGFVAVWSILGNLSSGWILLLNKSIKINDKVELVEDDIKGVLKDIRSIYTVLEDSRGNIINIPNNIFIQKIVKIKK